MSEAISCSAPSTCMYSCTYICARACVCMRVYACVRARASLCVCVCAKIVNMYSDGRLCEVGVCNAVCSEPQYLRTFVNMLVCF